MRDLGMELQTVQWPLAVLDRSVRACIGVSKSNKVIGDRMILNGAYLVDRFKESEFDGVVKRLGDKYEDVLSFKYTGPWPPYNFVNIKLRLERADA